MGWDYLNSQQKALELINILSTLAMADGELHETERNFLLQAGQQNGLGVEQIEQAIASPSEQSVLPTSEPERMEMLYYLIFLSRADHMITQSEERAAHTLGLKLGFREDMIARFLQLARKHMGGDIPQQDMVDNIRRFLN